MLVADRYEIMWCVEECTRALRSPDNSYDQAVAYFLDFGLAHPGDMPAPVMPITVEAGGIIASAYSPVDKLWRPGAAYDPLRWEASYLLDDRIKALPLAAMEAVLQSEHFHLKSENYAFSLALWWALEQPGAEEERRELLDRLLPSLRYTRMSAPFPAAIAQLDCPIISDLLPSIIQDAVAWPRSRVGYPDNWWGKCAFATHFTRAAVQALQRPGASAHAPLGLLHGFPCHLELRRKDDGGYALRLLSDFFLASADGAAAAGGGADRGLWFVFFRGSLGAERWAEPSTLWTGVARVDTLLECSAAALAYDEADRLNVELELKVQQHKGC